MLDELERERILLLKQMKHQANIAYANGSQERYKHHFDEAAKQFSDIVKILFPDMQKDALASKADELREIWAQEMGYAVGSERWHQEEARWEMLADLESSKKNGKRIILE